MANVEQLTRPPKHAHTVTAGSGQLTGVAVGLGAARALYVGVSGDVTVTYVSGASVQHVGLAAGVWHPMEITHVTAAGAATGIVAGY